MPARIKLLAVCVLVLCPAITRAEVSQHGARPIPALHRSQRAPASGTSRAVRIVAWTERTKYALRDVVQLNAMLRNEGDSTVFVDRRMAGLWDGGNLGLEITDEHGNHLRLPFLTHLPPPPPKKGDSSFLFPLETGYSYGTWLELVIKDLFHKPGRYSIQVTYHNWLPKEFVPQQLRGEHVLGAEAPTIVSDPLWIEVSQ